MEFSPTKIANELDDISSCSEGFSEHEEHKGSRTFSPITYTSKKYIDNGNHQDSKGDYNSE